ncbi:MAG TPA: site-specific integrase [Pyrinomonadaceae bacterium]
MSVFKRGGRWHYAFCIRGVRYRKGIPEARTKHEAERAEVEAKKAVFEGRYGAPSGEDDFMEFVEKNFLPWSRANKRSWYDDELWARAVAPWFKGKTFAQISPLLVERFKRERAAGLTRKGTERSPATVNRELEILSRVFSLAMDSGAASTNPCRKVKKLRADNRRTRYLLDEEEPRLFEALTGERAHLRPLVVVALGTGMRLGDELNLTWERVDFQRNVIRVPNAKTGRDYQVPMNEDVRAVMLGLRRGAGDRAHVFVNPETCGPYTTLKTGFRKACSLAGINNLRWHDLRHTFGTRLGEAGYSEATIAELMGHSSVATTRRYTHGTERAKREAVEAVRAGARRPCHNPATEEKRQARRLAVSS